MKRETFEKYSRYLDVLEELVYARDTVSEKNENNAVAWNEQYIELPKDIYDEAASFIADKLTRRIEDIKKKMEEL